ncbi:MULTISPECIES: TlpA disulfide reductase family protein [unclassified Rathayibacter]|uniref:TlpA family protein disulfide reductase n=1 Tax=unclassified Rathayibacter TaxID=2609250 RepID=UPI0010477B1D|nr:MULTISPECIES: TlpA disulfide reductase family protein [unclassified Rathayibacter]MCJ1702898.1 TlpA family protein disulfide reductase [Rathayibacter sp. VKM Ac-2926]TCL81740.1 thiol-disulfide isomerase/thioredoxin [Rathayibacter sp. PhB192]TCM26749.1 thiol-disulfide isomerase/thioredoxin [Rathayibacter sp. PhB179]
MRRTRALGVLVLVGALALSGCTRDKLAEDYRQGTNNGFISGDGTIKEVPVDQRGEAIVFTGTDEDGATIDSADLAGRVVVVNFWYASCAPCRAEAADLETVNTEFADQDVSFVGVNVRDQAPTAAAFSANYGLTYPSIVDTDSSVQLAFTGEVPPNAVPTTIVLDKEGRVASRILGQLQEASILSTLVGDTLAESE